MRSSRRLCNGFNARFENATNAFGDYPAGPGTVNTDPLLVDRDARDYHLLPGPSLVNAGIEPPGGLPAIDADGNVRLAGPGVDYGAFELGSTPPTTTTTVSTTPTSTTLPGCAAGASFVSVRCRLTALAAAVSAGVPPGKLAIRLAALAQGADTAVARAEGFAGAGKTRPLRKPLGRAARALRRIVVRLRSPKADSLDASVRDALVAAAEALATDVRTLRAQVGAAAGEKTGRLGRYSPSHPPHPGRAQRAEIRSTTGGRGSPHGDLNRSRSAGPLGRRQHAGPPSWAETLSRA